MDDDDATLMVRIRGGSDQAFNTLVDRHQQAVRAFLRRLLPNAADAEDIAQETFIAAWMAARRYRGGSSVRSWLFGIAWREAKMFQRSSLRRRSRETNYHAQTATEGDLQSSAEDHVAIKQALLKMPLARRAAVALCLAQGFSHSEAAEALGTPLGTIKAQVARGKLWLLKTLRESSAAPYESMVNEDGR